MTDTAEHFDVLIVGAGPSGAVTALRLAQEGYVGYIDVNCIVNGNGIYPLEFTAWRKPALRKPRIHAHVAAEDRHVRPPGGGLPRRLDRLVVVHDRGAPHAAQLGIRLASIGTDEAVSRNLTIDSRSIDPSNINPASVAPAGVDLSAVFNEVEWKLCQRGRVSGAEHATDLTEKNEKTENN